MSMKSSDRAQSKRFNRIRRSLSQKDTKVVVSLGGGGVRMFAHGVFLQLWEDLGAHDLTAEIWGASAGAIIGMLYSQGCTPQEIKEEGLNLYRKQHPMPVLPSRLRMAANLIKDAFLPLERRGGMKVFHDFQTALLNVVERNLKKGPPRIPFYSLAYNVENQDNETLTPCEVPPGANQHGLYQVSPLDAVAASSAIPILFQPIIIQHSSTKQTYLDGAMVEEVPTVSIYKKWMRDRELGLEKRRRLIVVGVNLHPGFTAMNLLENKYLRRLPGYEYLLLSLNVGDYLKDARNRAQKKLLTDDPNVELWELNLEMPASGMLNLDLIPQILEVAEKSFPPQLQAINRSLLV